jgi:hemolysin III
MLAETWPFWGIREPVSSGTHFIALLASFYVTFLLLRLSRGDLVKQLTLACFGFSMIAVYAASTAYHALPLPKQQLRFFQRLDHSAIYALIAGTYTPALVVLLPGQLRKWLVLSAIWALAIAGIACKWLLPLAPYWVTISLYFALGWMGLLVIAEFMPIVGWRGLAWAFSGGTLYTLGAVIDFLQRPSPYPGVFGHHELFHILSMGGTTCHLTFMYLYVVPFARLGKARPGLPIPNRLFIHTWP